MYPLNVDPKRDPAKQAGHRSCSIREHLPGFRPSDMGMPESSGSARAVGWTLIQCWRSVYLALSHSTDVPWLWARGIEEGVARRRGAQRVVCQ